MKLALPVVSLLAALTLAAGPAESAQPSKKDIASCAGQDIDTIIKGCTAIITKSPKNPRAQIAGLYNRGLAYYRQKDFDKALADHDAAIDLYVKNKIADRNMEYNLYLNRGRTKYSQKNWRGSAADSETATKVDTINPQAYVNWGYALLELEEYELAKKQLDWAIAVKGDEPSARALRGIINFYLGHYEDSLEDYNEALRLSPDMIWARSNRSLYYWWTGNIGQAMYDLGTVLTAEPQNVWARTMRARIFTQQNDYVRAQADLDVALAANKDFPVAHMVQGKIFRFTGRHSDARVELEKSLTLDATLIESLTTLAEMAAEDKDYPAALGYYDKAGLVVVKTDQDQKRHDDASSARVKLVDLIARPAKLAATCNDTEEATASRQACTELLNDTRDPKARLPLLLKRLETGYQDDAIDADIAEILSIDPTSIPALMRRAERGTNGSAIADLSTVLRLDPRNIEALTERARTNIVLRQYDRVSADIAAILAIDPNNAAGRELRVKELGRAKAWAPLQEAATAFALANPDSPVGWEYGSEAKFERGDMVGAFADATRAVELNTRNPLAHIVRGRIFAGQSRHDQAVAALSQALALAPKDVDILSLRAISYLALGNVGFARSDAESILTLKPYSSEGRELRARASFLNGEYARALADSSTILENNSNNTEMHILRANIRMRQQDFPEAVKETSAVINYHPRDAGAWFLRAQAKAGLGDMPGALSDLNEAARLDPGNADVYPVRARVQLTLGHIDEALADAAKTLATSPRNLEALLVSGEAYLLRGETVKAVEALEIAAKVDARSVRPLKLLGDAYAKIGSNDLALQLYAKAIDQEPGDDAAAKARDAARAARAELMEKMAKAVAK